MIVSCAAVFGGRSVATSRFYWRSVAGLKLPQQEGTAAQDDREQMVEIVGDPPAGTMPPQNASTSDLHWRGLRYPVRTLQQEGIAETESRLNAAPGLH